jgi:segregation and condensation protein B
MSMRLVWPDEETMPKKRKSKPEQEPAEPVDGPVQTAEEEAAADEVAEGQVEVGEAEIVEEAEEEDASAEKAVVDQAMLEAMLFSTHHPLTGQRLGELLNVKSQKALKRAVQELNRQYEEGGRTFRIEQVAGGYQMLSLPEYGDILKRLHQKEADAKLSKAALETLAIIA